METKYKLDAGRVNEIFIACLFQAGEDTSKHVAAHGVMVNVGFHPERLESFKDEIKGMLEELPNEFMQSGGGGWSFLNLCVDKHGNQWTGFHQTMDELVILGLATGLVDFVMPREAWSALPGSMPYIVVKDKG